MTDVKNLAQIASEQEIRDAILYSKQELEDLYRRKERLAAERIQSEEKVKKYQMDNKIMFMGKKDMGWLGPYGRWELNPHQKEFLEAFADPKYYTYCYIGGNRSGKTTVGLISVLSVLFGYYPWQDPDKVGHWIWKMRNWKPPIKVRIVGQDWEKSLKQNIVPSLKALWPKSRKFETRRNTNGVEAHWVDVETGGTIDLMSSQSDRSTFEGVSSHLILNDEPGLRENRVALSRGLVDYNGIELFCMTFITKDRWVFEDVINKRNDDGTPKMDIFCVETNMYNNEGYGTSKAAIERFKEKLTEEEIRVRIMGGRAYTSGLVLDFDRQKHVIERFEIPENWPVDVAIDIGVAKAHDILYRAVDPRGRVYFCFEEMVAKTDDLADSIGRMKAKYNLNIQNVISDPLAKSDKTNQLTVWARINNGLNKYGLFLSDASKDKNSGIDQLNEYLHGINQTADAFFFKDLTRTIRQIENWCWDDPKNEGDPKVISKKDDDMCENAYRLMLLNTKYDEYYGEEEHQISNSDRNEITGY